MVAAASKSSDRAVVPRSTSVSNGDAVGAAFSFRDGADARGDVEDSAMVTNDYIRSGCEDLRLLAGGVCQHIDG